MQMKYWICPNYFEIRALTLWISFFLRAFSRSSLPICWNKVMTFFSKAMTCLLRFWISLIWACSELIYDINLNPVQ